MRELPDIIHQLLDVIRIKNGIGTYGLEPHFRSCNICGELARWQNTFFLCLFLFVSNHPSTEQSEKLKSLSGREKKQEKNTNTTSNRGNIRLGFHKHPTAHLSILLTTNTVLPIYLLNASHLDNSIIGKLLVSSFHK